jgi:hypothetical protein
MATYSMGPEKTFTPLATGDYKITLKEWREVVEEEDSQYSKKGDKKIQWTFAVAVPNGEDTERRVTTGLTASYNAKSNLCHVLVGLGLIDAEKSKESGVTFDPDQGIGRSCIGTIVKKLRQGKNANDPGAWTDSITAYAPIVQAPQTRQEVPLDAVTPAQGQGNSKLLERAIWLEKLAGTNAPLTPEMSKETLVIHMKARGAEPINAHAIKWLRDSDEIYVICGGPSSLLPASFEGMSLKDALQISDRIEAATANTK